MVGDLGSDAGSSALSLQAKVIEKLFSALEKLINAFLEARRRAPARKREVQLLKEQKILSKDLSGEIKLRKLKSYVKAHHTKMRTEEITFKNQRELERFKENAKKCGLPWAGIYNKDAPFKIHVCIADKDISLLKEVMERCNKERKIEDIDEQISKIMNGRQYDELSEQEKINIDCLRTEKEKLQREMTESFNEDEYRKLWEKILNGEKDHEDTPNPENDHEDKENEDTPNPENEHEDKDKREDNDSHGEKLKPKQAAFQYDEFDSDTHQKNDAFSASLDAKTGRSIDKDRNSILADNSNPDRYIVCHGFSNPNIKSDQKIITEYTVHNAAGQTKTFTDDKSINKWSAVKEEMRKFGGFAQPGKRGIYLRFSDKAEFLRWQELARAQRENEDIRIVKDSELQKQLDKRMEELSSKGFEVTDDGTVVKSGEHIPAEDIIKKGGELEASYNIHTAREKVLLTREETLKAEEAVVIGKEIATYKALMDVNNDLAVAKTNVTVAELSGNDKEKMDAAEISANVQLKYEALKVKQEDIVAERNDINGLQAKVEQEWFDYKHEMILGETLAPVAEEISSALGLPKEDVTASIQNYGGAVRKCNLLNYAREVSDKVNELQERGMDVTGHLKLEEKIMDLYKSEVAAEAERERILAGGERDSVIYGSTSLRTQELEYKQFSFEQDRVSEAIHDRKEQSPIGKGTVDKPKDISKAKMSKGLGE